MRVKLIAFGVLCLISISILSSCKDVTEIERFPEPVDESPQVFQDNTENLTTNIESIDFFSVDGYLYPGFGLEGYRLSSITFFGTLNGEFTSNSRIEKKMNQAYIAARCIANDESAYKPKSYVWTITGNATDERNFRLLINLENEFISKDMDVIGIEIITEKGLESFSIGNYHIKHIEYSEPAAGFCFESPIELVEKTKFASVDYYIAIPLFHDPETISFEINISEDSNTISSKIISWRYDEELTNYAKKSYSSLKSEKELENFRIYQVKAEITSNTKHAVIQPYITAKYENSICFYRTEPYILSIE